MIPELLLEYPEGYDLTLLNTHYQFPIFEDGKKISDDFIILIYRDNIANVVKHKIIYEPTYTYYKLKDTEQSVDYSRLFIEREKVDPVNVKFKDLEKSIAENTGNEEFYKTNIMNRNKSENRKLHTDPDIFFSDTNIEDHYRFKFAMTYKNDIIKLNKGFFDIEVDGKFAANNFVELGECEINCVSFHDENSDKVYTFILRNPNNPLIEKFERRVISGEFNHKLIHDFVISNVGGQKLGKKYKLLDTTFEILFYDYEIDLIKDLFTTIHTCSPHFVMGWNSSAFDLEYIIERIKVLGYDPADILCDKRWNVKVVKNFIDKRSLNDLPERGDYTFISGNSIFIDQMIQYASRRKSKFGSFKSFKLDDIGLLEAGVKKLDYTHITKSVIELPWLDFETFVLYNIMDVVVQKCIEIKANDLEYIFSKAIVNNTVYRKVHRQTVYLINRMASDWYKLGYIIGNNCNRWNEKPPKFLGALVGDPRNTNDYSKLKINGNAIWVCDNCVDFDFRSLYPYIDLEFNIAPNTQIGRIVIPEKVYYDENAYSIEEEKYSRGGEFVENLVTDNELEFCNRWLHLGNFLDVINDIDEFYGNEYGKFSNIMNDTSIIHPLIPISDRIETPITFNEGKIITPITFEYFKRDSEFNYENLLLKENDK